MYGVHLFLLVRLFFLNCSNIIRLIYLEKEKNAMELQSPVKAKIALDKAKQAKKTLFKAFAIEDRNQNSLSTLLKYRVKWGLFNQLK